MKFPIRKSDLLGLLQKAINVVPNRSTLQILSNVLLKVEDDKLTVRATDLDVSLSASSPVKARGAKAEFMINARKIFDICKEMPDTDIQFDLQEGRTVILSTGTDEFRLPVQSGEQYPQPPAFPDIAAFKLKAKMLEEMSTRVCFAVSKDPTRTALKGVLWELKGNGIKLVATDGHKLSLCAESALPVRFDQKVTAIVPPKALEQFTRLLGDGNAEVEVRLGKTYAEFKIDGAVLTTKLIEGEYPNYEQVIPAKNTKRVTVKREELFSAIRRISVMANSKTRQIRLAFEKNSLNLSTSDRDFNGEGKSTLSVAYTEEPLTIGFNADFLIEILRLIDDEEAVISMNTPLSAAVITPKDKKNSDRMLFLIMPLRLIDEVNE